VKGSGNIRGGFSASGWRAANPASSHVDQIAD
jgi:hypothetical protein